MSALHGRGCSLLRRHRWCGSGMPPGLSSMLGRPPTVQSFLYEGTIEDLLHGTLKLWLQHTEAHLIVAHVWEDVQSSVDAHLGHAFLVVLVLLYTGRCQQHCSNVILVSCTCMLTDVRKAGQGSLHRLACHRMQAPYMCKLRLHGLAGITSNAMHWLASSHRHRSSPAQGKAPQAGQGPACRAQQHRSLRCLYPVIAVDAAGPAEEADGQAVAEHGGCVVPGVCYELVALCLAPWQLFFCPCEVLRVCLACVPHVCFRSEKNV